MLVVTTSAHISELKDRIGHPIIASDVRKVCSQYCALLQQDKTDLKPP